MFQRVNLYQPIFREEHKLFSAATIGAALGVVAAGLVAIAVFSGWRLAGLDRQVAAVQAQEAAKAVLVARANSLIDGGESPQSFESRLQGMALELQRRQQALRYLRGGAAAGGAHRGFAGRLAALAHQQLEGLWLTGVILTADARDLTLSGGATRAELVPAYLGRLANETAFAGTKLQSIEIRRPPQPLHGQIGFTVSSASELSALPAALSVAASAASAAAPGARGTP